MSSTNRPINVIKVEEDLKDYVADIDKKLRASVLRVIAKYQRAVAEQLGLSRLEDLTGTAKWSVDAIVPMEHRLLQLSGIVDSLIGRSSIQEMKDTLDEVRRLRTNHFIQRDHVAANTGVNGVVEDWQRRADAFILSTDIPTLREIIEGKDPEVTSEETV